MTDGECDFDFLAKLYHKVDSPAGFASAIKLLHAAKRNGRPDITLDNVKTFLKTQKSYTLHGNVQSTYPKRKVIVNGPGHLLSADLADVSHLKSFNNNFRFLGFFIDCFSRKLSIIPLLDKKGTTLATVLDKHLNDSRYRYNLLWVDEGKEWFNQHVNRIVGKHHLKIYNVYNRRFKAAYAERSIRTVKQKLYKILTHFNTNKYINHLPDIVKSYNSTPHRGLMGATPDSIHDITDKSMINELVKKMIKQKNKQYGGINTRRHQFLLSSKSVLPVGSYIRLLLNSAEGVFTKSYKPIYTTEIFVIDRVCYNGVPISYFLKDLDNEPINGIVYRNEITEVSKPQVFLIEEVLKSRMSKKNGVKTKEIYVKYLGYPDKFSQWIPQDNILKNK